MLKDKWLAFLVYLMCAAALTNLALDVFAPASAVHPANGAEQEPANNAPKNEPQWSYPFWLSFAFWEAFATGVIAVFAIRQYGTSRESSEQQLRAYINLKEGGCNNTEARITVKNFGQTPAYAMSFWADAIHCDPGVVPEFKPPEGATASAENVIAPSAKFLVMPDIRNGRTPGSTSRGDIFAFGAIRYRDVFDKKDRVTEFFLTASYPGGSFRTFGPHNTAT